MMCRERLVSIVHVDEDKLADVKEPEKIWPERSRAAPEIARRRAARVAGTGVVPDMTLSTHTVPKAHEAFPPHVRGPGPRPVRNRIPSDNPPALSLYL